LEIAGWAAGFASELILRRVASELLSANPVAFQVNLFRGGPNLAKHELRYRQRHFSLSPKHHIGSGASQ